MGLNARKIAERFVVTMREEFPTPAKSGEFVLVHMADTHAGNATLHNAMTAYLRDNKSRLGIAAVMHSGDVADAGSTQAADWTNANTMFNYLDTVPFLLTMGNHDYDDILTATRDAVTFNTTFPQSRYTGKSWWAGGFYEANHSENAYNVINIGGVDWLFLSLEFGPRQEVIDWANALLTTHSTKPCAIATHSYLFRDGSTVSTGDMFNPHGYGIGTDAHDGAEMWTECFKLHDNVKIILSGHDIGYSYDYGIVAQLITNTDGASPVWQSVANYQELPNNGNGFMHFIRVNATTGVVVGVETFSPTMGKLIDVAWVNTELCLNRGFETAGAGGGDVFAKWTENLDTGTIVNETSVVHSGSHALKLTALRDNDNTRLEQALLWVIPGSTVKIDFRTRGDGTNQGRFQVYDVTHGASIGSSRRNTGVTATDFTLVSTDISVPAGCTSIRLGFFVPSVNNGVAYFDDVSMRFTALP